MIAMYDEVVSNYDQPIAFVIGFAGSGKSTELAKRATPTTLILTPTHKAAEVLMGKGLQNVYTIHATLKLVPTLNQNFRRGQKMERLNKIGNTDLKHITDVFIDEYSMISVEIMDILLATLPSTCKVTLFGDSYQLPAITGTQIEPEEFTDAIIKLTTQHRSDAPEVVETFMRFVAYLDGTGEMNLTMNPKIKRGTLKEFNPTTDRILAYTNARVLELNDEAASILGMSESFSIGDELTVNGMECTLSDIDGPFVYPQCMSKGKLMDSDKLMLASMKATNDIEKWGTDLSMYDIGYVNVEGDDYTVYYDANHYATSKILKNNVETFQFQLIEYHKLDKDVHLPQWCKDNKGAKFVKERGEAWSRYIAHNSYVFDMRRPYATTVHKAQGSEFSTVFIAIEDVKKAVRNGYYDQYARLMYVALSRAIKRVILV